MSKKNMLQSSIEKALKNLTKMPKQHKHAKIKGLLSIYQKEAWKAKPNYNLMLGVTKKIKGLRGAGKKW